MNGIGFLSNIIEDFEKSKAEKVDGHCTVKPLELMRFLIRLCVPDNDNHIVLDPFAGTGTTCRAAKELGHHYVGIEISEKYGSVYAFSYDKYFIPLPKQDQLKALENARIFQKEIKEKTDFTVSVGVVFLRYSPKDWYRAILTSFLDMEKKINSSEVRYIIKEN